MSNSMFYAAFDVLIEILESYQSQIPSGSTWDDTDPREYLRGAKEEDKLIRPTGIVGPRDR